jgi:5,5'-dehydrodivanillate O-demethylase
MLTAELNERLTQTGRGTPAGEMLRRYWYPIAGAAELLDRPTKRVRLLGEDLVLYRNLSGRLGLLEEPCAHRRISLYYGIPEQEGLRCPYHGWLYDASGQCIEQPCEPEGSTFKNRVRTTAYPVQEMGGLVFAYLGPAPAPLLPRYDLYVCPDAIRQIGVTVLPCNWLQAMENSVDQTHVEWLHGHYTNFIRGQAAAASGEAFALRRVRHHVRLGFDRFEHGIIKRRIEEGGSELDDDWQIGHPIVFPYVLKTGATQASSFQIRVPMDDTHTYHILYKVYRPGIPVPAQDVVPVHELPWEDERGNLSVDFTLGQDMMAWVTQGAVARRDLEKIGAADTGIIMLRELVEEQIDRVARGEDPIEVYRDPAKNQMIELPQERVKHGSAQWGRPDGIRDGLSQHMPTPPILFELFRQVQEREERGEALPVGHEATLGKTGGRRREIALKG